MRFLAALLAICATAAASAATQTYVLLDTYAGSNFFSAFDFFNEKDPSNGFVNYVDATTAFNEKLAGVGDAGVAFIRADAVNVAADPGRKSVRLVSKKAHKEVLFVADFASMPANACGIWPAYWTVGYNWPQDGEIDIIEGVSEQDKNLVSLHSDQGCGVEKTDAFTGHVLSGDCYVYSPKQASNTGCGIQMVETDAYGDAFNKVGGGVYAVQVRPEGIVAWYFRRDSIPTDLQAGAPQPDSWGPPAALFSGDTCNISQSFHEQRLVLNINFCGDWAGNVWSSQSCRDKAPTCVDWVRNNPSAFVDAQWAINYIQVFKAI